MFGASCVDDHTGECYPQYVKTVTPNIGGHQHAAALTAVEVHVLCKVNVDMMPHHFNNTYLILCYSRP